MKDKHVSNTLLVDNIPACRSGIGCVAQLTPGLLYKGFPVKFAWHAYLNHQTEAAAGLFPEFPFFPSNKMSFASDKSNRDKTLALRLAMPLAPSCRLQRQSAVSKIMGIPARIKR